MENLLLRSVLLGAALPGAAAAQAVAPEQVTGEVMFVAGSARRTGASGADAPVAQGLQLVEGDRLRTGADSHVYVRLRDGGLLVLRPSSELRIDLWHYDPARPQDSRIRYTLDSGVARSVSGQGARAARQRFRFNTPLAAIGVRGTDFTVLAEPGLTRVAVRSGGVVVQGFGEACRVEGLGPCEGPAAVELFASARDKLLQLRLGERRPELVDDPLAAPDKARPAAPGEPVAGPLSGGVNVAEARGTEVASQVLPVPQAPVPLPPAAAPPPDPAIAVWGRWAPLARHDSGVVDLQALMQGGPVVAINKLYALVAVGVPGGIALPGEGVGRFGLVAHEGWITDRASGRALASSASDGRLSIDFGTRRFDTSLTLRAGNVATQVTAQGTVEKNGSFVSDPYLYPSVVQGLVGGVGAGQAQYIYQRSIDNRYDAAGATSWHR